MKSRSVTGLCGIAALAIAGTALPTLADGSPADKGLVIEQATPQRAEPYRVRGVRWVNGKVIPTTEWIPYKGGQGGVAIPNAYAFDAYEGVSTVPTDDNPPNGNRYLLSYVPGQFDLKAPNRVCDMVVADGFAGATSEYVDIIFYSKVAGAEFNYALFTAETIDMECTEPVASDVYDGVEIGFAAAAGFWYSNVDLTGTGLFWQLPMDGSGAYIIEMNDGLNGNGDPIPANGQTGLWGTGDDEIPPDPRPGTQDFIEYMDDSTGGVCADTQALNIPNGVIEPECECYTLEFDGLPADVPNPLASSLAFGAQGGDVCYPDCDGDQVLSIDDFVCFQSFFAFGDPYADCDGDNLLSIDDFVCFQSFFAFGCN
jgi:hypothetical protein